MFLFGFVIIFLFKKRFDYAVDDFRFMDLLMGILKMNEMFIAYSVLFDLK